MDDLVTHADPGLNVIDTFTGEGAANPATNGAPHRELVAGVPLVCPQHCLVAGAVLVALLLLASQRAH